MEYIQTKLMEVFAGLTIVVNTFVGLIIGIVSGIGALILGAFVVLMVIVLHVLIYGALALVGYAFAKWVWHWVTL